MRKFLIKTGLFIIVLWVINFGLLQLVKSIYISDYTSVSLHKEIYLLADSHGASLDTIPLVYGVENFSDRSDSYIDLERKLKYLLRNGKPKTIYLTVDAHMLSPDREAYNNNTLSAYFTTYEDYPTIFGYVTNVYLKRNTVYFNTKYVPLLKNYFVSFLKRSRATKPLIPWENKESTEKVRLSMKRFKVYFTGEEKSATLEASLQRIIALCKEHHIELVGVKFPVSPTYNTFLKGKSFEADMVFKNHNLPVLNFQDSLQADYYFRDQDHLNNKGATVLAELLFREK
ncbi:hypothetical protein [Rasiella sp. SM2506]|uniref:hypothetical protein n=1 Tax=Rasiella sp. SM2506 TaxID=3423914 RepID=UPI003D78E2ED